METKLNGAVDDLDAFVFSISKGDRYLRSPLRHAITAISELVEAVIVEELSGDTQGTSLASKDTALLSPVSRRAVELLFSILISDPGPKESNEIDDHKRDDGSKKQKELQRKFAYLARGDQVEQLKLFVLNRGILRLIELGIIGSEYAINAALQAAVSLKSRATVINEPTNVMLDRTKRRQNAKILPEQTSSKVTLINPLLASCIVDISSIVTAHICDYTFPPIGSKQAVYMPEVLALGEDIFDEYQSTKISKLNTVTEAVTKFCQERMYPTGKKRYEIDPLVRLIGVDPVYLECIINHLEHKYGLDVDEQQGPFNFNVILPLLYYLLSKDLGDEMYKLLINVSDSSVCDRWGFLLRPLFHLINPNACAFKALPLIYRIAAVRRLRVPTQLDIDRKQNYIFLCAILLEEQVISRYDSNTELEGFGGNTASRLKLGTLGRPSSISILELLEEELECEAMPIMNAELGHVFITLCYYLSNCKKTDLLALKITLRMMQKFTTLLMNSASLAAFAVYPLLTVIDGSSSNDSGSKKVIDICNKLLTDIRNKSWYVTQDEKIFGKLAESIRVQGKVVGLNTYLVEAATEPYKFLKAEVYLRANRLVVKDSDVVSLCRSPIYSFEEGGRIQLEDGPFLNEDPLVQLHIRPRVLQFIACSIMANFVVNNKGYDSLRLIKQDVIDMEILPLSMCQFIIIHDPDPHVRKHLIPRISYLLDNKSPLLTMDLYSIAVALIGNKDLISLGLELLFNISQQETKLRRNWDKELKSVVKARASMRPGTPTETEIARRHDITICTLIHKSMLSNIGGGLNYLPFLATMLNARAIPLKAVTLIIQCFNVILTENLTDAPSLWDTLLDSYFSKLNRPQESDDSSAYLTQCAELYSTFYAGDNLTESYLGFMEKTKPSMLILMGNNLEFMDIVLSKVNPIRNETFVEPILRTIFDSESLIVPPREEGEEEVALPPLDLNKLKLGPRMIRYFVDVELEDMSRPLFKGFSVGRSTVDVREKSIQNTSKKQSKIVSISNDFDLTPELADISNLRMIKAVDAQPIVAMSFGTESAVRNLAYLLSSVEPPLIVDRFILQLTFGNVIDMWRRYWCRQVKNNNYNLNGGAVLCVRHLTAENGVICDVALAGLSSTGMLGKENVLQTITALFDGITIGSKAPHSNRMHGIIALSYLVREIPRTSTSTLTMIFENLCKYVDIAIKSDSIIESEFTVFWGITNLLLFFATEFSEHQHPYQKVATNYLLQIMELCDGSSTGELVNATGNLNKIKAIAGFWCCVVYSSSMDPPSVPEDITSFGHDAIAIYKRKELLRTTLMDKAIVYLYSLNDTNGPVQFSQEDITLIGYSAHFITKCITNGAFELRQSSSSSEKLTSEQISLKFSSLFKRVLDILSDVKLDGDYSELRNSIRSCLFVCKIFNDSKAIERGAYICIEYDKITQDVTDCLSHLNSVVEFVKSTPPDVTKQYLDVNQLEICFSITKLLTLMGHIPGSSSTKPFLLREGKQLSTDAFNALVSTINILLELNAIVDNSFIARTAIWALVNASMIQQSNRIVDLSKMENNVGSQEAQSSQREHVYSTNGTSSQEKNQEVSHNDLLARIYVATDEPRSMNRFNKDKSMLRILIERLLSDGCPVDNMCDILEGLSLCKRVPVLNWSWALAPVIENILKMDLLDKNLTNKKGLGRLLTMLLRFIGKHCRTDYLQKAHEGIVIDETRGLTTYQLTLQRSRRQRRERLKPVISITDVEAMNKDGVKPIEAFTASPSMVHVLLLVTEHVSSRMFADVTWLTGWIVELLETLVSETVLGTLLLLYGLAPSNIVHDNSDLIVSGAASKLEVQYGESRFYSAVGNVITAVKKAIITTMESRNDKKHSIEESDGQSWMELHRLVLLPLLETLDIYVKYDFGFNGNLDADIETHINDLRTTQTRLGDSIIPQLIEVVIAGGSQQQKDSMLRIAFDASQTDTRIAQHCASLLLKLSGRTVFPLVGTTDGARAAAVDAFAGGSVHSLLGDESAIGTICGVRVVGSALAIYCAHVESVAIERVISGSDLPINQISTTDAEQVARAASTQTRLALSAAAALDRALARFDTVLALLAAHGSVVSEKLNSRNGNDTEVVTATKGGEAEVMAATQIAVYVASAVRSEIADRRGLSTLDGGGCAVLDSVMGCNCKVPNVSAMKVWATGVCGSDSALVSLMETPTTPTCRRLVRLAHGATTNVARMLARAGEWSWL